MLDVGFLLTARAQDAVIRPFARDPALASRHLDLYEDGERSFVVMGRLHRRDRDVRWLRGRAPAGDGGAHAWSDAALCAALYVAGGLQRLRRVEGEFVIAAVDRAAGRLLALRDPLGSYPCFWAGGPGRLLVSTSIRALGDELPSLEPDLEYVADLFALSHDSFAELPTRRTAYRGVNRLLPGWCLQADLRSPEARPRPSWEWPAALPDAAGAATLDAAAALVREALERAVGERLSRSGGTGCHLSGGLDSTSVALLAGRELRARGTCLEAVTLAYVDEPLQRGESAYVAAALEGRTAIHHHRCPADDLVEFAGHERIPLVDEPSPMVADFRRMQVLLERARSAGADCVLTGDGGDVLFAQSPALMAAQLLRAGRPAAALALARAKALARSDATADILRGACRMALSLRFPGLAARAHRRRAAAAAQDLDWLAAPFVEQYAMAERVRAWESRRPEGLPFDLGRMPWLAGDWYHWNLAVPLGMTQTRPFLDTGLTALVAALPADVALRAAPMKPLLAAAVADLLPEKILRRPSKGHFDAVLAGFAVHEPWLLELVGAARGDPGVIAPRTLARHVELAAMGAFADAPAANRIAVAVGYLTWCESRERWRAQTVPYTSPAGRSARVAPPLTSSAADAAGTSLRTI